MITTKTTAPDKHNKLMEKIHRLANEFNLSPKYLKKVLNSLDIEIFDIAYPPNLEKLGLALTLNIVLSGMADALRCIPPLSLRKPNFENASVKTYLGMRAYKLGYGAIALGE